MSLSKAQLTTFASTIAHAEHDTTTFSQFFDDVVEELGMLENPPFAERGFEAVVSGTSEYDFESSMIKPLYIFLDDTMLSPVSQGELEAYSKTWQTDDGTPIVYTLDNIDAHSYRIYPEPDTSGSISGADWGSSFPDDALALIYSEDRQTDIEDYYALPITFDCLAREFSYPSDHQDIEYAKALNDLAKLLYMLAGVNRGDD
jgi:hypothetical protein